MKLTLRTTEREASDVFSFVFTPERLLRWKAGQYLHYKPVFYVSGPESMVKSLDKILKTLGVSKKRVKCDFFPGYHGP